MTRHLFRVLYALSPSSSTLGPVVMRLGYNNGHNVTLIWNFVYKPNPSIGSISPTDHLTRLDSRVMVSFDHFFEFALSLGFSKMTFAFFLLCRFRIIKQESLGNKRIDYNDCFKTCSFVFSVEEHGLQSPDQAWIRWQIHQFI